MTAQELKALKLLVSERKRALIPDQERCAGCGTDWDSRTIGCKSCLSRWDQRRRRGTRAGDYRRGACAKCGCDYDSRTPGCGTCYERWKWRNGGRSRAGWRKKAAA